MRIGYSLTATTLTLAATAASAVPVATLDGRAAVTYVSYGGGFAIAYDSGSDGSELPVSTLAPTLLGLSGSHTFVGAYLGWDVTYTVEWDLAQNYVLDAATHTLTAEGSMHLTESSAVFGPSCNPCAATVAIGGTNTQQLDFSLSESAAYSFHSETTPGQWVNLSRWNAVTQRWDALWFGAVETQGKVFDRSGILAAGLYRLDNTPYTFVADGVPPTQDNAWFYVLTLPDAELTAAVPAPASAVLLAGSLGCLAWRRRRG